MKLATLFPDFEPKTIEITNKLLVALKKENEFRDMMMQKMRQDYIMLQEIAQKVGVAEDD